MNHLRGWAVIVMCVSLLCGCSNQKAREQLVRDVERLVLEHERFVQDIERYHQERQRLQERAIGLIAAVFLSALITDGEDALAQEATRIVDDEQDFAPEAKRLYGEGQRIAQELRQLYEKRDELVADDERLYKERERLAQDLDQVYQTVELIGEEFSQAYRAYDLTRQARDSAKQEFEQWRQKNKHTEQAYDKAWEQLKRVRIRLEIADENLRTGIKYDRKIYQKSYEAAAAAFQKAYDTYYPKIDNWHNSIPVKTLMAAIEAHKQAEQTYNQEYNRLEQDLERAYLNWNWLKPYLDRLIRDMGLRVRVD